MGFIKKGMIIILIALLSGCKTESCTEFVFKDHVKVINGFYKGYTGVIHKCWFRSYSSCSRRYEVKFDGDIDIHDDFSSKELSKID